ncbi:MAG: hypothetical protein QGG36_02150 [Pirellulaceae bacterium]|nr:hypothetical protein [Pirellulaceae bacterium]MDP7014582.1 hypothetical protein [Pirellulaceae bacterium]
MQVDVTCPCSHRFTVYDDGRADVLCSRCGHVVKIRGDTPVMAQVADKPSGPSGVAIFLGIAIAFAVVMFGFVGFGLLIFLGMSGSSSQTIVAAPVMPTPFVTSPPANLPALPFVLPEPPAPDVTTMAPDFEVGKVEQEVMRLHAEQRYQEALPLQYWVINHSDRGEYNMACLYGLIGDVDHAFYWLQRSSYRGVDVSVEHMQADADLRLLRLDSRWATFLSFAASCEAYWDVKRSTQDLRAEDVVVKPQGYDGTKPLPLIIALHGRGERPEDLVGPEVQKLADEAQVVVLSVAGSADLGPAHDWVSNWNDGPYYENWSRLEDAMSSFRSNHMSATPKQVFVVGFGSGAAAAAELVIRRGIGDSEISGAVLFSPLWEVALADEDDDDIRLPAIPIHVICGEGEHSDILSAARITARRLREGGAQVDDQLIADENYHRRPKDFWKRVSAALELRGEAKATAESAAEKQPAEKAPAEKAPAETSETAEKTASAGDSE